MAIDLKEKIYLVDNGRFKVLIDTLKGLNNYCADCDYFNPHINDHNKKYRCHVMGYCPAATLSPKLQEYIWRKIDEMED